MDYVLHFAHLPFLCGALVIVAAAIAWRLFMYKPIVYTHSLSTVLKKRGVHSSGLHKKVFFALRVATLVLLAVLLGKPRFVDPHSKLRVQGIDIVLALDVSGSMSLFDSLEDRRPRIQVAKEEAVHFIQKRENDAIGLVLFGADAVSRCPLTLDKRILTQIVNELELGIIDYNRTMLSKAVITAANRLKQSKAKSKVMILLTDGAPSEGDLDPQVALEIAKKLGIKIYTVGIGGDEGGYFVHPLFGLQQSGNALNSTLLQRMAVETGGQFFEAKNPHDMRTIYDTIDTLEKN